VEAGQLPVTTPGGPFQQPPYKFPPNQLGGKNIVDSTIPISFGQRMQAAVERYRNNRVIPPVNVTTTSMTQAQAQAAAATANTATSQTTTQQQSAPAAAVRY
jgi:hypothetical protein